MNRIVIVGRGLSGTLLLINLLRLDKAGKPLDITVIERNHPERLGVAYSTNKDFHLLNVSAAKMSAFPDKKDDFVDWLNEQRYPYHRKSFVPRAVYRQYILHVLATELLAKDTKTTCTFIHDAAKDVIASERLLLLDSGKAVFFDQLILAVGNFKATKPGLPDEKYLSHPAFFESPWDDRLFDQLAIAKRVLILGTGLSMIDMILGLWKKNHQGNITALSTHGFMPHPHADTAAYELAELAPESIDTCLKALKIVNKHLKLARQQGISWHSVIDAVRPYTQQIWQNFSTVEKKRFMEHVRHIWGVARHRIPQESAVVLYGLLAKRQLSIVAGRIRSIQVDPAGAFVVEYQERASGKKTATTVDIVVNCMGPESNYERLKEEPFIRNLLKRSLIRTDDLRLGIDCNANGNVIDAGGLPSSWLYTIGPPAKGILWEITSVPEIRLAALKLAESVVTSIRQQIPIPQ